MKRWLLFSLLVLGGCAATQRSVPRLLSIQPSTPIGANLLSHYDYVNDLNSQVGGTRRSFIGIDREHVEKIRRMIEPRLLQDIAEQCEDTSPAFATYLVVGKTLSGTSDVAYVARLAHVAPDGSYVRKCGLAYQVDELTETLSDVRSDSY